MKVIPLSQENDRQAWLEARRGVITGTKAKGIKPLTRGADRTPQGFWQLLAEKLSIQPDGENVMDRGHRLQREALELTAKKYNLDLNLDPGMWISDIDDDIGYSPDGVENKKIPTYAVEVKCFDSANHFKYIVLDKRSKNNYTESYNPFNSIPKDNQDQLLQAFIVNDKLCNMYFVFYDDRVVVDDYMHYVIIVNREHVKKEIEELKEVQINMLTEVNKLLKEITNE